jgi:hypothetical protein
MNLGTMRHDKSVRVLILLSGMAFACESNGPAITSVGDAGETVAEAREGLRTLGGTASTTEVWLEDYCSGPCPAYGSAGDWATVIQAAMSSAQCAPYSASDSSTKRRSCTLRTAGNDIRTTQSIHVCRPIRIVGSGRGAGSGNTTLTLAGGASIYFHFDGSPYDLPATKCPWNPGQHVTSGGAELSNLTIRRDPTSALTGTWVAVEAHASIVLTDLTLSGFDQGVLIHGNVLSGYGNANGWRANGVGINGMAHRGWEVRGADANAGSAVGLVVANTCQTAGAWNEATPDACAGLIDDSFLGNHYAGVSVQYNFDVATGPTNPAAHHPSFWITSPTTVDYAYEETNSRGSYLDDNPSIMGGNIIAGTRCNGGSLAPCSTNAFCLSQGAGNACVNAGFRAAVQKGNIFNGPRKAVNVSGGELIMGDYDSNTAWGAEVASIGSSTNMRFSYDSTYGTWCLRSQGGGNGGSCVASANAVSQDVSLVAGASWLGKQQTTGGGGVWIEGNTSSVIEHVSGAAADPNGIVPCKIAGSLYQNTRPAVGETLVWLCRCTNGAEPTAAGACSAGFSWVPLTAVP